MTEEHKHKIQEWCYGCGSLGVCVECCGCESIPAKNAAKQIADDIDKEILEKLKNGAIV